MCGKNGLRLAQFEAVPFARIVGGRDHHAAVRAEETVCMVGHRGGAQADVDDVRALLRDAAGQPLEERLGVRTHVAPHDDLLRVGEDDECAPDLLREFRVDLLRIDAPDVVGLEYTRHGPAPQKWLVVSSETSGAASGAHAGFPKYIKITREARKVNPKTEKRREKMT